MGSIYYIAGGQHLFYSWWAAYIIELAGGQLIWEI
jgi:hypothetical protein